MQSGKITKLEQALGGTVLNIEHYHIHDGEGVRTNVFLKGCNLTCPWCCNPESQRPGPQIGLHRNLCTGCRACLSVCPAQCCTADENGLIQMDDSRCSRCGACVACCPVSARELYGVQRTVADVMAEVEKDTPYYRNSDGGVTLSGGEACLQPAFAKGILDACRRRLIHTALETAGAIPWESFWPVAGAADVVLLDMKTTRAESFASISPVPLETVRANLLRLREAGRQVVLRCPIIPGFNDNRDHIDGLIAWGKEARVDKIDLLPFHQLGSYKYQSLNLRYSMAKVPEMDRAIVEKMADELDRHGFHTTVGG